MKAGPLALQGFLPAWDVERRAVDLDPLVAWTLARLREQGHAIERLERCHERLDDRSALAAARALTAASLEASFRRALHAAVAEALGALPLERVWIQTYAHFRILVPGCGVSAVPPHTDFGFGHDLCERNVWLALTDAEGPGALHLARLTPSLAWHARAGRVRQVGDDGPPLAPIEVRRGDVLLFTPLHVHGARPPEGATRVSIDVRVRPAPDVPRDLGFWPLGEVP